MSILPSILEVANQHHIRYAPSSRQGEYIGECPFCHKKDVFQMNALKGTFICNRQNHCGKRGGIIDLISLLTGENKEDIIRDLRQKKGLSEEKSKPIHPALEIPIETLKEMGFLFPSKWNWYDSLKKNRERTMRELDWIWKEYQEYCEDKAELKKAIQIIFTKLIKNGGVDKLINSITK